MTDDYAWITYGSHVDIHKTKQDALSWKWCMSESGGGDFVAIIEGPNGEIVPESEWDAYVDAVAEERIEYEARKPSLLGKVMVRQPGDYPNESSGWQVANWVRDAEDCVSLMERWTARLGADRVRWDVSDDE